MSKMDIGCIFLNGKLGSFTRARVLSSLFLSSVLLFSALDAFSASVTLIETNSVWKYNDNGVNLGTSWRLTTYDDSSWAGGRAELGYGDGDEATTNKWGPDAANKYPTYYYRKEFTVTNLTLLTNVICNFLRDDGIVVFINGTLAFYDNFPDGTTEITYNTYANVVGGAAETTWYSKNLSKSLFVEGRNVIAVEIHQCDPTSSDISFNLALIGEYAQPQNQSPIVTLVQPTNNSFYFAGSNIVIRASATDPDGTISKVEFYSPGKKLGEISGGASTDYSFTWTNAGIGIYRIYAVAFDNNGASSFSTTNTVSVYNQATVTWRAFNDHYSGAATHPNATAWNALGTQNGAPGNAGPLKDIATGKNLPVVLTITSDYYSTGGTMGKPDAGTPAGTWFLPYIDFGTGDLQHAIMLAGSANHVTYTFTGLNPNCRYIFKGTAVRGGGYSNRWSMATLNGAQSFRGAHVPAWGTSGIVNFGALTSTQVTDLTTNQMAWNAGENRADGVMMVWEDIVPQSGGQISVKVQQYLGKVPTGQATDGQYSYALSALSLEQISVPPVVVLTAPTNNSIFVANSVSLSAVASSLYGVASVVFYANSNLVGSVSSSPFNFTWTNVANGAYQIFAVVTDSTGVSATSAVVNIQVSGAIPPKVSITSPASNATFTEPANITISATATDQDGTVSLVEFYQGQKKIGEAKSNTSEFSYTWTSVPAGNYVLTAIATDNTGLVSTSAPVSIQVVRISTGWVAFNDHVPGPGTHTNTTTWNIFGYDPGATGYLKNIVSGTNLPVRVSISYSGNVMPASTAGVPAAGTPLYNTFNGYVDFSTQTYGIAQVSSGAYVTYTFTGLNPNARYSFKGGVVRGSDSYVNRWTIAGIEGAVSYRNAHTANALTSAHYPNNIKTNEAAINTGVNHTSTTGDMWDWEDIDPGSDGSFSVYCTQYTGPQPNGTTDGPYGYAIGGIRLEEYPSSAYVSIITPTNNAIFTYPTNIQIQASAYSPVGVNNVAFYANSNLLTRVSKAPYETTWTNPPVGTNFIFATMTDVNNQTLTSSVVRVIVNQPAINTNAPVIVQITPVPGSTVGALTSIQVIFSENVVNVDASDLLINGIPATGVSGSGTSYTFTFTQPSLGNVAITWASNHGIVDTGYPPLPFDHTASGASWSYYLADLTPPTITSITPAMGSTVNELTSISITFSEAVAGVNASDLLINGSPAISVAGANAQYTFYFAQPAYGAVQISWAANHGITDLATPPNAFDAQSAQWHYTLEAPKTVLIATNAVWKYKKGTSEASSPITAWRLLPFDDSSWLQGPGPFYYDVDGTPVPFVGNTRLDDMRNTYVSLYLRHPLVISNLPFMKSITINTLCDDGYILWINGIEVIRYNTRVSGDITYDNTTPANNAPEPLVMQSYTFTNLDTLLINGTNLIAIQALNVNLSSSDFLISMEMTAVIADPSLEPPRIASVNPVPGEVYYLTNLTVTFTEPVKNVDASDLLVNGVPATFVSGQGNAYTFGFAQPAYGNVSITWASNHGIVDYDSPPRSFDGTSPSATFQYVLLNPNAPVITSKSPSANSTVSNLTQVVVTFNKPVVNVDAQDLLINGTPASGVSGDGQMFTFTFPQPPYGAVSVRWAQNHGIVDASNPANKFDETRPDTSWQYNLIDLTPPTIISQVPSAGATVTNLSQITVTFSESVKGVDARDLLVNGIPATSVSGSGAVYTFTFPVPNASVITITWLSMHGITDLAPAANPFNENAPGSTWQYHSPDVIPPRISNITPIPGITVRDLTKITVLFDEPVKGVDASDLLINTSPAQSVSGSGAGPYVFTFNQPATGVVQIVWTSNHGITDLATPPNSFTASPWSYVLDPNARFDSKIVISEIMFNPSTHRTNDEWIEIHNTHDAPINLTGWKFTRGIDFMFPNISIPGGGYLVIASDTNAFKALYPTVTNVIGNWRGRLSNIDERLTLVNSLGETIDDVWYATEGDWGVRRRGSTVWNYTRAYRGWEWYCAADGYGKSFELVQKELPNEYGQNWKTSSVNGGTPGASNSVASTNIPPMILDVIHIPAVPTPTNIVTVRARILDEQTNNIVVTLYWRDATSTTPSAFSSQPMFDDGQHNDGIKGDMVFAAQIPPMANNTIIEFYVEAVDNLGLIRTWPAPAYETNGVSLGQVANALYQVDSTASAKFKQPIYRLIMTGAENQELQSIWGDDNLSRRINAEMNGTFIAIDDSGTDVRYLCGFRNRGNGTRGAVPHNFRVNIPNDRRWKGQQAFNLNTMYTHSQVMGTIMFRKAGLPVEDSYFVRVRVNGVDLASSGNPQYGCYVHLEELSTDWAQNHFPLDGGGNLYRCMRVANLHYLGTNWVSYTTGGYNYSKQSNRSENDWSDLFNMTWTLDNTPDTNWAKAVSQVLNVSEWQRYFAVMSLTGFGETALGSDGTADDYTIYRGEYDTRFMVIPHDNDTDFGEGDGSRRPATDSIFRAATATSDTTFVRKFLQHQEFVPMYYGHLYELATTIFQTNEIHPALDHYIGDVVDTTTLNRMKTWTAQRVANVLSQINLNLTLTNLGGLSSNQGYLYTSSSSVTLAGRADVIHTRQVKLNDTVATWVAWNGNWQGTVSLNPGINNVLIQCIDSNNVVFAQTNLTVWYDKGSVTTVSGTLSGNPTWSPANGPYYISSSITIPSGVTLTILPGTTVYLNSGANITVSDGGRLIAEGTPTARITFTRTPGTSIRWGGIIINGSVNSPETRIGYAHIEYNGSVAIHSSGGTVYLHHLTFGSTDHQYVSLDNSSFIVSDCLFPTPTAAFEPAHGSGGIKQGGRGIFLRNFFGAPNGYNDTIDFTGGNRPGPIVQFIDNVFMGSGDDVLDLDGTDAWVEGNIFMHIHKNGSPDSASAISGGRDGSNVSRITIINNIFYDLDHVATAKEGNFYVLINNTIVRQSRQGGTDTAAGVINFADAGTAEGAGMYLEGNIVYNAEQMLREPVQSAVVTLFNNLLPFAWTGLGGSNFIADPMFKYVPQVSETTNFVNWTQAQVIWDWFSLRNTSPAIGRGESGINLGATRNYGVILTGIPDGITSRNNAQIWVGINRTGNGIPTASWVNGVGYTHYKWRIEGGQWSAELPITTPIVLTNLVSGTYKIEVAGKRDCGFYQDDPVYGSNAVVTISRTWTVDRSRYPVRINEVLAANRSAYIHYDTTPDMIELYNESDSTVSLAGMSITDDPSTPTKFIFPSGTTIPARSYLVLFANNTDGTPGLHLGFNLAQEGEGVYLFARPSEGGQLLDSVVFGPQVPDYSIGKLPDGSWGLTIPTFGQQNKAAPIGDSSMVKINEWLASGGFWFQSDFIELYNPEHLPVSIGGMFLTDRTGQPTRHQIAPLTFIASNSCLAFFADGDGTQGPQHLNFRITYEQGQIELYDSKTNLVDRIVYLTQKPGVSQGRSPNGKPTFTTFNQPTPGIINPSIAGGLSGEVPIILVNYTDRWRYNQSGTNLGTGWIATNYNDSTWTEGSGVLGYEDASLPYPINTWLTLGPVTFYFRKTIVITNEVSQFSRVQLSYLIDDGAVFYFNGQEVHRVRISGNAGEQVAYDALASTSVGDAAIEGPITISPSLLRKGTNYIAVEVHQSSATSSDIVFAMLLEGIIITNPPGAGAVMINEVLANNSTLNESDGSTPDWVELYNSSSGVLDLSGWSLTDNLSDWRRWVFPQGSVILPGGYLKVICDANKPVSTTNTGFGLKANGGAVYLFESSGVLIDSINYGIQIADFSIGRVPNGSTNWTLTVPTAGAGNIAATLGSIYQLKINEWMPNDSGGRDDWFEIYNPQSQPVAIGGLKLTDNLAVPGKHVVVPLSFIGSSSNGYLKIIADNNLVAGADHVGFKLDNTTESIGLFTSNDQMIDSITYYNPASGVSEGRFPDGSTNIVKFTKTVSPGAANYLWLTNVIINEALSHSDPPLEDAIELYNPTDQPVDISGWYLSDSLNNLRKFRIPPNTIIPPRGFKVFYEYQFNSDPGVNPFAFALGSRGDQIYLSTADSLGNLTGYRRSVKFGASRNGVSFGYYVNSVGEEDFVALGARTFGVDDPGTVEQFRQGTGASNAIPKVGPLVISEIMYHPPDIGTNDNVQDEYIELYNNSSATVMLYDPQYPTNTWRLRDAIDYEFPMGASIPPFSYALVVSFDPQTNAQALAEFKGKYNISDGALIFGPYRGKLANGDENIELYEPDTPNLVTNNQGQIEVVVPYVLVEKVHYYDSGNWPSEADGNGYSLHRVSYTGYANDPTNWVAAPPTPGPQGLRITAQPQDVNAVCGQNILFVVEVAGQSPIYYQWYFNGTPIVGQTNNALQLLNVCTNNAGAYHVVAYNSQSSITSAVAKLTVISVQLPSPGVDYITAIKNQPVSIPVAYLLANDRDYNGSTLSIVGVSATSTNGGYVSLVGNSVIYTPPANKTGFDEFFYTVQNGYGLQAMGVVSITVGLTENYNKVGLKNSNGRVEIQFEGLPGMTYEILRSRDLKSWELIMTLQAGNDGIIRFTETDQPSDRAYYRVRRQ
ncbi:MAG: lamin tail domain-containing protein [Verrucomicrobiae bacterium]|nr:lamin tail domain-containing protein [Verrucomicrobiae bacterium]